MAIAVLKTRYSFDDMSLPTPKSTFPSLLNRSPLPPQWEEPGDTANDSDSDSDLESTATIDTIPASPKTAAKLPARLPIKLRTPGQKNPFIAGTIKLDPSTVRRVRTWLGIYKIFITRFWFPVSTGMEGESGPLPCIILEAEEEIPARTWRRAIRRTFEVIVRDRLPVTKIPVPVGIETEEEGEDMNDERMFRSCKVYFAELGVPE